MIMVNEIHRNTKGLDDYRKKKQADCSKRVDDAIRQLIFENKAISFNSVSEAAGVSKKYLYEHFYDRINELRENQGKRKRIKGLIKSDKSKDVIIQAKDKRIKKLEERVRYLELLLNKQCADIYDNL